MQQIRMVATKTDFLAATYLEGEAILAEARASTPRMLTERWALSPQWAPQDRGRRLASRWR
jgi:hypothetical protein